jgi:hypothetical protein
MFRWFSFGRFCLIVVVAAAAAASACTDMGAQGPPGPKGDKGDPGMATVLDGGATQGPPGPAGMSVQVEMLAPGDATCPTGGVRLTAGAAVTVVCNGSPGVTGPKGDKGDPGMVTVLDGGVVQGPPGPPGASVTMTTLSVGDAACPQGGVKLTVGATSTNVCNGAAGATGPQGPTGAQGATGTQGGQGPAGTQGPQGMQGPQGPQGAQGLQGMQGPPGASGTTSLTPLSPGSAACPYGGTQLMSGADTSYACNGGPVNSGNLTINGGIPPATFAGYTPQALGGNLNGRSGAHALCDAAFTGSHFCADWELTGSDPPAPVSVNAWVDLGNTQTSSRFFRSTYSTREVSNCGGWTTSSATAKPDGVNTATGQTFTTLGGFASSFVGTGDGGCESTRPLACCTGGTAVRFRGFSPSTSGGNLGGRTGANALCGAAFASSHFCSDWEVDQAAVRAPIPAGGAWVDLGNSQTTSRFRRSTYSTQDVSTCGGWTTSSASARPDGVNTATGLTLTTLGGTASSFVASGDGGCEVSRPLACCDGFPPQ